MLPCVEFGFRRRRIRKSKAIPRLTRDKAWAGCGRAGRSIGLVSMQARQTRRRLKIYPALGGVAAAFFEPNVCHDHTAR